MWFFFFSEDTWFTLSRSANIHDTIYWSYQNPLYIKFLYITTESKYGLRFCAPKNLAPAFFEETISDHYNKYILE